VNPKQFKYKAFISYSHQDKKWGDWLHRALETYRVPKGLIGKQTGAGVVPKCLFPIFRDREELPTSHELGRVINKALDDSSHLIVICSPRSAKSQWVNEEIKQFKCLGKSDNILCLIVDGEPNAADKPGLEEEECFPEAAKYEIGEDGELLTIRTEPIAADAREGKDGKRNALLKLAAGLLAVGFDNLKQRDLTRKQKRMAIFSGISMALVAIMAGLTFWALDQQREAERQRVEAVNARDAEAEQREVAIKARDREAEQRQKAELAKQVAFEAQKDAEWKTYVNQINLADVKVKLGDIRTATKLLWDTNPEYRHWEWGRLMRALDPTFLTLNVKSGYVQSANFSPDGYHAVTGDWGGKVKIWSVRTGELVAEMNNRGRADSVAYSRDGSMIASGGKGKWVRVWDARTGLELKGFKGHETMIRSVAFSPDGKHLASVSNDEVGSKGLIIIWDINSSQKVFEKVAPATSIAFSPHEQKFLTTGPGKQVLIWDFAKKVILHSCEGHKGPVFASDFSPDGKNIASGGGGGMVDIWDVAAGKEILSFQGHEGNVWSVCFSPDGKKIATSGSDNTARIWDSANGKLLKTIRGHARNVPTVDFHPDGKRLLTGSFDRLVKIWPTEDDDSYTRLAIKKRELVRTIDLSPDGTSAITASDKGIKVWDTRNGVQVPKSFDGHSDSINSALFSQDGESVITASDDNTSIIWNAKKGEKVRTLIGHQDAVLYAAFSSDGRKAVTTSRDKAVKVWDVKSGQEIYKFRKNHAGSVTCAAFSADGTQVVTGGEGRKAIVWNLETEKKLVRSNGGKMRSLYFFPDGRRIAGASAWRFTRIWDSQTGKDILKVKGHISSVTFACLSPDGKRLVSMSQDKTIRVWDTTNGNELLSLSTGGDVPAFASFSGDGLTLATVKAISHSNHTRIWKALDWKITSEEYQEYKKQRYEEWLKANDPETK
jgi:WD40 repeat protein